MHTHAIYVFLSLRWGFDVILTFKLLNHVFCTDGKGGITFPCTVSSNVAFPPRDQDIRSSPSTWEHRENRLHPLSQGPLVSAHRCLAAVGTTGVSQVNLEMTFIRCTNASAIRFIVRMRPKKNQSFFFFFSSHYAFGRNAIIFRIKNRKVFE